MFEGMNNQFHQQGNAFGVNPNVGLNQGINPASTGCASCGGACQCASHQAGLNAAGLSMNPLGADQFQNNGFAGLSGMTGIQQANTMPAMTMGNGGALDMMTSMSMMVASMGQMLMGLMQMMSGGGFGGSSMGQMPSNNTDLTSMLGGTSSLTNVNQSLSSGGSSLTSIDGYSVFELAENPDLVKQLMGSSSDASDSSSTDNTDTTTTSESSSASAAPPSAVPASNLSGANRALDLAHQEFDKDIDEAGDQGYISDTYSRGKVQAWCADFVSTIMQWSFGDEWDDVGFGHMPAVQQILDFSKSQAGRDKGWEHVAKGDGAPRKGDIAIWKQGGESHVEIVDEVVEKRDGSGNVYYEFSTVGGNTSDSIQNHDVGRSGNSTRYANLTGFARPPYEAVS